LESKQEFSHWIKARIEKFGLIENADFEVYRLTQNYQGSESSQNKVEYHLTLDCAKQLAMVENNEKGKLARLYFIEAERKYKESLNNFALPTNYKEALLALVRKEEEKEALQLQLESQKDKVEFAEQLLDTTNALDFKTAAKAMNLGYGRNTLFIKCKELGILDRSNQPYQKYVDAGYFVVVETSWVHPKTGDKQLSTKTLITAKGQQFLLKKLNQELGLMEAN
jgi:anti-repressor protein